MVSFLFTSLVYSVENQTKIRAKNEQKNGTIKIQRVSNNIKTLWPLTLLCIQTCF